MKLVHMGQNEWMFEEDIIAFPGPAKAANNPADDFNLKLNAFIESRIELGCDINDIMQEAMVTFEDEMLQELENQPPSPFQVIQHILDTQGYEEALEVAKAYVLDDFDNPDAHFNLAFLCEEHDDSYLALLSSRECMRLYLQCFPKKFNWNKDKLPWGILENRPFLRALYQLANLYADNGCFEQACEQGEKLIAVCPIDNLGIRETLVDWYMYTQQYDHIIQLCDEYPEDMLANITFGKALAYCYKGELEKALLAWDEASDNLPEVAHELTKKRHSRPKGMSQYGISIGGKDQAYYYWQDMGEWWENNETAQMLIEKKRAEKKKK